MAQDIAADQPEIEEAADKRSRARGAIVWQIVRWGSRLIVALLALLALLVAFLHTPPGRQFIVDQIASFAPASGLSVEVGDIDGSILLSATLHDVRLRDANGTLFLEVPEIDLNWRPYRFLWSGLDIRHLVLSDGTLYAAPELVPGDPDAPTLPDFDIRIDRLLIENMTVAPGLLGERRTINFRARTDIRDGLVFLDADGDLGGGDVFEMLVHAEPDGNRFDLDLDYQAPAGGLLAGLIGVDEDLQVRLEGDGTWAAWAGRFDAIRGGADLADLAIYNRAGRYRIAGRANPAPFLSGLPARALGNQVEIDATGTLVDSVLRGTLSLQGQGLATDARGAIDLGDNVFAGVELDARLLDPGLLGGGVALRDTTLTATLDGPFRNFVMPHELRIGEADMGGILVRGIVQEGMLTFNGARFALPVNASLQRIVSGNRIADPRLVDGRLAGLLLLTGDRLVSDDLALRFPGLAADMAMQADLSRGIVNLAGPVTARGLAFENIGLVDARASARIALGSGPWRVSAQLDGRVSTVTNPTIASLAGERIRFAGAVALGGGVPITFRNTRIEAEKLEMLLDGRISQGTTTLAGSGTHTQYGPFDVEAELAGDGPRAVLVFADPLPAAGLTNVRVALSPTDQGLQIETAGGSTLGEFAGLIDLTTPEDGDVRLGIRRLTVSETLVSGNLALVEGGVAGTLDLSRGGVDGTVDLAMRDGGQAFDAALRFAEARFGGATPLTINRGTLNASGYLRPGAITVEGETRIAGFTYGSLFLRRVAARARISDGTGTFDGAIAGRRGSRFALLVNGQVAPGRVAVALDGEYAGRDITMPRRAVLTRLEDGAWRLGRTQLGFGDGFTLVEGRFGGNSAPEGEISLARMPLSLIDAAGADLGLGGTISGVIDFGTSEGGQPVGSARVKIDDLTRSGLILTSQPMDLAVVAELSPAIFQARAVMDGAGGVNGRLQARIAGLPADGGLIRRLSAGELLAQLRYSGPSAALWRLIALDILDVSGPLRLAANVRGTLAQPRISGSLAGDSLRVQSALTGSDVSDVEARARFAGSRLALTSFSGTAPNGGSISGSGTIDLANLGAGRGPRIDLRMAADNAQILNLPTMGATVTGPLRIVSSGVGGTVAGRLQVRRARWRLGAAAQTIDLPRVPVDEVNLPPDLAPTRTVGAPWRYLIDARAANGIEVDGMGLDSEWSGEVRLRGTTDDPRIGGEVEIVPRQGFYTFAGSQFEITRGRILFEEQAPPDPTLEIVAQSTFDGVDVAVNVGGTAGQPEIAFSSVPALPEEELLARILFGGSVTELSATDALQLGSALASLRGGGGMGPINRLRTAIGLDRLRIVPADPALDRNTAVALGKNITRRFYAEVITDGANYNATEVEFRVTSWLSLLGSLSTIGRHGVAAEYSRDY